MTHLVMSRREFAGVSVTMTTASALPIELHQPRRVVALGWISRGGGQVTISDRLNVAPTTLAGR
jgi:hypothetical protein